MKSFTPIIDYYQFKQRAKNFNRNREERGEDFSPAIQRAKGNMRYPFKNRHDLLEQNTF